MIVFGAACAQAQSSASAAACPAPQALTRGMAGPIAHVRYLADDALEGREVGSAGERCAAEYVAAHFRALGLQPVQARDYLQRFAVRSGSELGEGNRLAVAGRAYRVGADWVPLGFSASARVEAPSAYAHHGWEGGASPHGQAHTQTGAGMAPAQVAGKIAVIHAEGAVDAHRQAQRAAERGAVAVVFALAGDAALPDPGRELRPRVAIPVAVVRGAAAEAVLAAARAGQPLTLAAAVRPREVEARNVAALLPGSDPRLKDEVVIVGAHLDHLGWGGSGSLAPDARAVHNGADDNASGVAAMLEVARRLAAQRPARSVLFLAFSGEERGLLGSAHYTREPLLPLERTVAMLNLDMVGRLRNSLSVLGVGTAGEWRGVVQQANQRLPQPIPLAFGEDGFGPSDHSSFYARDVPVLHFFTNAHEDYHRPSDDWERIDPAALERVTALVAGVAGELAGGAKLTLVKGAGDPHGQGVTMSGSGAYLGTIPDYTPIEKGVRISGVREGSPAQQAGLKGGDVILAMDGKPIADIYAYTYALRDHRPGDVVKLEVQRDGQTLTLTATMGSR